MRPRQDSRHWVGPAALIVIAVAAVGAIVFVTTSLVGSSPGADPDFSSEPLEVTPVSAGKSGIDHHVAEPETDGKSLEVAAPAEVEPGANVTFEVRWVVGDRPVTGQVDLQRAKGKEWSPVEVVPVEDGEGSVSVPVESSGIYRVVYAGSDDVDSTASSDIAVLTGKRLKSHVVTTIETLDEETVVTAGWTDTSAVPIVGELELQERTDDEWKTVETVTTDTDGTATVEIEPSPVAGYRFVYPGGSRFAKATSEPAELQGEGLRAIPVSECTSDSDIDVLAYGAACHYTPVSSGTFVVGHDYLGNAWWNTAELGSHIELSGAQAGLYEVVDRVMAPARGAALGPASNWTCGSECDVILQTCRGDNTGFTWLRRVDT